MNTKVKLPKEEGGESESRGFGGRGQAQHRHLDKDLKTNRKIGHHTLLSIFCCMSTPAHAHTRAHTHTCTPHIARQASSTSESLDCMSLALAVPPCAALGRTLKALGNWCVSSFWALDFSGPIDYDDSRKNRLVGQGRVCSPERKRERC